MAEYDYRQGIDVAGAPPSYYDYAGGGGTQAWRDYQSSIGWDVLPQYATVAGEDGATSVGSLSGYQLRRDKNSNTDGQRFVNLDASGKYVGEYDWEDGSTFGWEDVMGILMVVGAAVGLPMMFQGIGAGAGAAAGAGMLEGGVGAISGMEAMAGAATTAGVSSGVATGTSLGGLGTAGALGGLEGAVGGISGMEAAAAGGGFSGAAGAAGGLEGVVGGVSGMEAGAAAGVGGMTGPTISTAGLSQAIAQGGGTLQNMLSGMGLPDWLVSGASSFADKLGVQGLAQLIGGFVDRNAQSNAAEDRLNYIRDAQSRIDGYYSPNSPEWNYMWNKMSAADSAGGRNSQYGTRMVDFMGQVADKKTNAQMNLTNGMAGMAGTAYDGNAASGTGLASTINNLWTTYNNNKGAAPAPTAGASTPWGPDTRGVASQFQLY